MFESANNRANQGCSKEKEKGLMCEATGAQNLNKSSKHALLHGRQTPHKQPLTTRKEGNFGICELPGGQHHGDRVQHVVNGIYNI